MSTTRETATFDRILYALGEYAENPSAFLALNSGNEYFTLPGSAGVVVHRRAGRYLIQFGGPFASERERPELLDAFLEFAREQRRRVVAVQIQGADVDLFGRSGFTVNQIGCSYALALPGFSLKGTRFVKLRNKISRARRAGLEIDEVALDQVADDLAAVDRPWLRAKGRHVKEIEFLVGQLGGPAQSERRLFVGRIEGKAVAYISYSPVYGRHSGWLHDLTRRVPSSAPGVLEAVNMRAVEVFRSEGAQWLHFGFTPFTGLSEEREAAGASALTGRFLRFLADHGERVYPAAGQLAYKEKWAPDLVLPEYLAFHGRARAGAVWRLLRVTNAV
ncbi:bifunctional lysylphosphatidylglycerol flippase/synthetase MprF [Streptomyces sp. CWNU-52B]|uniref:bifunctional lysylphosphatidylglycerol flippase/synthetase MprF n=1 Tax=unclassified Streptomyces TaxID=2593676 RepID=UPI0039C2E0E2